MDLASELHKRSTNELISVIQQLSLARSIEDIQKIVREAARRLTGADGATFILRDGYHCFYVDEDAISPLWKGQRFPMETCVSGWAMLNRAAAVIEDIYDDERVPVEAYRPTFVKSMAMVPIRMMDPIGAIGNYWATRHAPTEDEVRLLQALADSTAVAIENIRSYQEVEEARQETLRRLALAAEYRDDETYEHTERVAHHVALIAEKLGLRSEQVDLIRQAAPLHDIGKLAIPDSILLKPGRLTPEEFEVIKAHPQRGAEILSGSRSDVLRLAQEIALAHHEWWDGTGYPHGTKGEDIPLSGRIVAVSDVFDALTHDRPYKSAWSYEDAIDEIARLKGKQFDPEVVAAFQGIDRSHVVIGPAHRISAAS